ncbi:MAG: Rieske (2Fe-2S) protein [Ignavibacterium sp.]|nr:MAG: Rieske (2Fe-2S) protein [Ignavibacterium sp.]
MDNNLEDGFEFVCRKSDLKENIGCRFIIDDIEIALFKVADKVFALSNICPHQHTALIYNGMIEEGCIVCPVHGWMFDLKTGNKKSGSKGLDTYPVRITNEEVFVKVLPKEFRW